MHAFVMKTARTNPTPSYRPSRRTGETRYPWWGAEVYAPGINNPQPIGNTPIVITSYGLNAE